MFYFENLLRNEYFPAELPPCFTTESFADNHLHIIEYIEGKEAKPSTPLIFSAYKNSNSRRKFAVPNPFNYAKAASLISEKSDHIYSVLEKSKFSLTSPIRSIPDKDECYKRRVKKISESKNEIQKLYQDNHYEVRIDIQSFFESIYTHSVAWAMHTKALIKKNNNKNDKSLTGNILDKCLQNMNSGQTNGILVGNSISRIISEIILCTVDSEILNKHKDIAYLRFVDDYYIFVKDSSNINNILATFRQELAKYGLLLNENKLQIIEGPFIYGKPWVEHMKAYTHLRPQILLEKAIIEYRSFQDVSIFKYALKVIRTKYFTKVEWQDIEPIIINIWVRFPNLSNIISLIFKNNEDKINKQLLKKSIYRIVETNLLLKNDEEVIWAVWICKQLNIKISQMYIKKILESDNWLAIIVILDIISGRKNENSIKDIINKFRVRLYIEYFKDDENKNEMFSSIWLLAYEADKNKWLNTSSSENFCVIKNYEFFNKLKTLGIDFYDSDYSYEKISNKSKSKIKSDEEIYITKKELSNMLKMFRNEIETLKKSENKVFDEGDIFDTVVERVFANLDDEDDY